MKRILSVLLALTMLLSLSSVGFANAYINYTYMDEITGFTYHFGRFDEGATDAGLMVNGIKRSLTGGNYEGDDYANAFAQADANSNLFGIGIKPASTYEGTTYTAAPYATVNGVDVVGQEVTYSTEEYTNILKDVVLNDVVVADVMGATTAVNESSATAGGNYALRTFGNSASDNQIYTILVKLDLTKIPEAVKALKNNNYILTLTGSFANWTQPTSGVKEGPEKELADQYKANVPGLKINAYAAEGAGDWTEDNAPTITVNGAQKAFYHHMFGTKAENPVLIDSVEVPASATTNAEYGINLTSLIQSAIAEGKEYTSVCFCLDDTYAKKIYEETEGVVSVRQIFCVIPNEAKAITLSCQASDLTVELNTVTVGDKTIGTDKFDSNNTYTIYLPYGTEEFPVVSATCNAAATATVTQATIANNVATIVLTNKANSSISETYKINFVVSEKASSEFSIDIRDIIGSTNDVKNVFSVGEQTGRPQDLFGISNNRIYSFNSNNPNARKDYVPSIGFVELDLTSIKDDIDLAKDIKLNATITGLRSYDVNTTKTYPEHLSVGIYDVTGFNWSTLDRTTKTTAQDLTILDGKTAVANLYGSDISNSLVEVDLSEFIKSCIENNNLKPTLAFFVNKPNAYEEGGSASNGNRVIFDMNIATGKTFLAYSKY